MAHKEQLPGKLYVFPTLGEYLAPSHSRIECRSDDLSQMAGSRREEILLLGDTHDSPPFPALPDHRNPAQWISKQCPFVYRPKEDAAETLDVPVDGCIRQPLFLAMACLPVFLDCIAVDSSYGHLGEMR